MKLLSTIALVLAVAACTNADEQELSATAARSSVTTTEIVTATSVPETTGYIADAPLVPGPLASSAIDTIQLDGQELLVAIADTAALRRQGLMNVPDLLDLDGMLFVFDVDSTGGFWMRDTLIPLDIAFFDATGAFVDGFLMEPCTTRACPTYRANGPYRYALEMAAGDMPANPQELGTPGIRTSEES